ncbi:MAG: hypothetical protein SGI84_03935 [Gemmatimonadota bacterium]|nr:hypothetical protein [Gemmatimonadota bacterium]
MSAIWGGALLLGLLLGWLELRRVDQRHRLSRTILVLLATLALGALLAPPRVPGPGTVRDTIVVVTPGGDEALLQSARDSFPGAPVTSWPDSVADLDALQRRFPSARRVVVVGWGLRSVWWQGQDTMRVWFMPGQLPAGFHSLEFPPTLRLGERAVITGVLRGTSDSVIVLEGPDGTRDTVPHDPSGGGRFEFAVTPAAAGRIHYVLSATAVPGETVSVAVEPATPPAVLVVEGAPSFETTFLRRWLSAQGGRVAIRTRLSLDRDRTERVNLPDQPLRPFRSELLAQFDLVMLDGPSLRELSPDERRALVEAVQDKGLGLLVAPDSLARRDEDFFPFRLLPTGELDDRQVRPRWVGHGDRSTTAVPAAALEVGPAPGLTELIHDPVGRIIAATTRLGIGRIGTSLLLAPSRWQLEGDTAAYAAYWSRLYQATARGYDDRWELVTDGPVQEQLAVDIGLTTDDPAPRVEIRAPDGSVDTVGVAQDLADPARWWGRFWPRMPGWHEATNQGRSAYLFDVAPVRLSALEASSRRRATMMRAAVSPPWDPQPGPRSRSPLPPLIPFVVLVAALGSLWAEGRGLWDRVLPARHS